WRAGILAPLDMRAAEYRRYPRLWRSARRSDRPETFMLVRSAASRGGPLGQADPVAKESLTARHGSCSIASPADATHCAAAPGPVGSGRPPYPPEQSEDPR